MRQPRSIQAALNWLEIVLLSETQRPGLLVAPSDDSGAKNQADANR